MKYTLNKSDWLRIGSDAGWIKGADISNVGDESEITISGNCIETGKPYSVTVKRKDYDDWKRGKLAQKAFPYLSKEDREFIISGVSPEGWKKMFPPGDED